MLPSELGAPNSRHRFSQQEDQRIRELVELHGDSDWLRIAEGIPGRTARQCRERYRNYLCRKGTNEPWTWQEELVLMMKFNQIGPVWTEIARALPNRTNINVKNHWTIIVTRANRERARQPSPAQPPAPPMPPILPPPMQVPLPPQSPSPPPSTGAAEIETDLSLLNEFVNTYDGAEANLDLF